MYYDINSAPYFPKGWTIDELKKYQDIFKGWSVFISPEGLTYKVNEWEELVTGHDNFAYEHVHDAYKKDIFEEFRKLKMIKPSITANLGAKDILINLFGYVCFDEGYVKYPDKNYANKNVTDAQVLVLDTLYKINGISAKRIEKIYSDDNLLPAYNALKK